MCGAPIPAYTFCVQCPPLSNVIMCLCHTWLCQGVLTSSSLLLCYFAPVEWSMINQAQLVYPGVALPAMLVFVFYAVSHPSFSFNIWPDTLNLDVRCPPPFYVLRPMSVPVEVLLCAVPPVFNSTASLCGSIIQFHAYLSYISSRHIICISYAYHWHMFEIFEAYLRTSNHSHITVISQTYHMHRHNISLEYPRYISVTSLAFLKVHFKPILSIGI